VSFVIDLSAQPLMHISLMMLQLSIAKGHYVCLSVTLVIHAYTAESIKVCFTLYSITMFLLYWWNIFSVEFRGSLQTDLLERNPCQQQKFNW